MVLPFHNGTSANQITVMEKKDWKINRFAFKLTINSNNACKPSPNIILEMVFAVAFQTKAAAHWKDLNGCNQLFIDFALTGPAFDCGRRSHRW